jgi:O-antigen ligase
LGFLGVVAVLLGFSSLFTAVGDRFTEMLDPSRGTIWLRLSLWRASLMSFLSEPLTGLGPGTFRDIETIFPGLRFDPAMVYIKRLSAHNLFLHYLAETGLLGAAAITTLFFRHFKTSIRAVTISGDRTARILAIGLLGTGATIFFSIFYLDGWMWSQNAHAAPLFIALTARLLTGIRERRVSQ